MDWEKENLLTEEMLVDYRNFAQEQLANSIAVENAFLAIKNANKEPDVIDITFGNFDYQKQKNSSVYGKAQLYLGGGSFYRLINTYLNGTNLDVSIKHANLSDNGEIEKVVASVSYSYDSQNQKISINECLGTKEIEQSGKRY